MTDALKIALDRFDVPPLSTALADRIMASATGSTTVPFVPPRRDQSNSGRRGNWRRGRQVLLGSLAAGLLSAGAVASGLLGRVGIEVPVLTAMLAPKPVPVAKPTKAKPKPAPVRAAEVVPPPAVVETIGAKPPLLPAERFVLREERRERRRAFAVAHPIAAAIIRERVRQELQRRAEARRQALATPGVDASLPGNQRLDPADRLALARAARRDRLAAERLIDRQIQLREARMAERAGIADAEPTVSADPIAPAGSQSVPTIDEVRAARRARLQQISPEERALVRERIQQRRERWRAQQEHNDGDGGPK